MSQPSSIRGRAVAADRRCPRRHYPGLFALLAGVVAACGGDDEAEPVEARLCRKLDTCNYLLGYSVGECTDDTQRCTEGLSGAERHDWAGQTGKCLNFAGCQGFVDCYLGFSPQC